MAIEEDLLDQLLAGRDPQDLFARDGLVDELTQALSERLPNAELDERLVSDTGRSVGNHRNGRSKKTMLTGTSKGRRIRRRTSHATGTARSTLNRSRSVRGGLAISTTRSFRCQRAA